MNIIDINRTFKEWAESHPIIQLYKDKPIKEIIASDLLYPLMWVEYGNIALQQGQNIITINVMFLDRLTEDDSNLINVLSDMLGLVNDFHTQFNENEYKYDFLMSVNSQAVPIVMQYDDKVAGYNTTYNIQVRNIRNENEIPV